MNATQFSFPPRSSASDLAAGLRDMAPLTLGVLPFGVIFGALAFEQGLTVFEVGLMSVLIYAGASQFVALGLLAASTHPLVIIGAILIVNLRHLLYSAWLGPHVMSYRRAWRMVFAFGLADEVFAVMSRLFQNAPGSDARAYYLGASGLLWAIWWGSSLAGAWLGQEHPVLFEIGHEIAMPLTFACMGAAMLTSRPAFAAAVVAGATAWVAQDLPWQIGLVAAALMGIGAGFVLSEPAGETAP